MKEKKCKFIEKLDRILNKANNYFFVPLLLIFGLILLKQHCQQTEIVLVVDIVMTVMFFAWMAIVIYKLCRKITKIEVVWPLIVALVALMTSLITSFANEKFASNVSFIVGMFFMEVFLIYLTVYDVYNKSNRLNRVIISSVLFVVLGYTTIYYSSYNLPNKELFNSLIAVFSAIVGGGLTLGGVAWTIKHEKEVKRREEEQKLLTTCPLLSFQEIDKVVYDGKKVNAEDKNPNMLVIDEDKDKKLVKNTNMMFRFVFHCNNDIPIKNIHFESIHIYPEYDNQSNMGRDYFFRKVNEDNEEVNVSFLNTNDYQAVAWLVADVEKNQIGELYNNLAVFGKFSKVFIDIVYDTVNIHNVTYKAELKFLCKTTVLDQGDSIEFKVRDYSNVSNWIVEQPHIIEKK